MKYSLVLSTFEPEPQSTSENVNHYKWYGLVSLVYRRQRQENFWVSLASRLALWVSYGPMGDLDLRRLAFKNITPDVVLCCLYTYSHRYTNTHPYRDACTCVHLKTHTHTHTHMRQRQTHIQGWGGGEPCSSIIQ